MPPLARLERGTQTRDWLEDVVGAEPGAFRTPTMAPYKLDTLGLAGAHPAALTNKYSGRKLNSHEEKEQLDWFDSIKDGELLDAEEDSRAVPANHTSGLDTDEEGYSSLPVVSPSLADRLYDPQQVQPLPRLVREDLHYNKAAWRKLYVEHDVTELAEVVMQEEIEARLSDKKALFVEDTEWSTSIMQNIILFTDRILLESILFGNLAKDRRANPKLEVVLRNLKTQPLYFQSMVDGKGDSPTANQLLVVCDHIRAYAKGSRKPDAKHLVGPVDDVLANKIDNFW
jgi:hypothetical protein